MADPIVDPFPHVLGVAFEPPPAHLLPDIMASMARAIATLPPDADGAIVGIATDKGANAAIVARLPAGFEVQAWIGKSWGERVTYGAEVQKVFTWK